MGVSCVQPRSAFKSCCKCEMACDSGECAYRFIILSPILLLESRVMLSPKVSSLCFSLLAESRRCDEPFSAVGVPSFDACCTWTTGIGISRFAMDSELSDAMTMIDDFCSPR